MGWVNQEIDRGTRLNRRHPTTMAIGYNGRRDTVKAQTFLSKLNEQAPIRPVNNIIPLYMYERSAGLLLRQVCLVALWVCWNGIISCGLFAGGRI